MSDRLDIHAYADGELGTNEFESRLNDPTVQAELDSIRAVKSAVSKLESVNDKEAWQSCVSRLNEIDRAAKVNTFVGKYAWAICSVFFVFIFGAAILNRVQPNNRIGTGDLAYMASSLSPLAGSGGNTQRYLEQLGGTRPALNPEKLTVNGAAYAVINGRPVTRFDLMDAEGPLVLLVTRADELDGFEQKDPGECYRWSTVNGRRCLSWCEGGYAVALFGDRDANSLEGAAALIRSTR
ncbi:MAG TPA: hypothetical protein PKA27_01560 [Fimbriimonadaceae bacterium]|nr:hypothetical protein [Fimbriimonadaceae bacterium]